MGGEGGGDGGGRVRGVGGAMTCSWCWLFAVAAVVNAWPAHMGREGGGG